jgi:hypothetical protein
MPQHRKNKAAWVGDPGRNQPWFVRNVARQRKAFKAARLARRIQRRD